MNPQNNFNPNGVQPGTFPGTPTSQPTPAPQSPQIIQPTPTIQPSPATPQAQSQPSTQLTPTAPQPQVQPTPTAMQPQFANPTQTLPPQQFMPPQSPSQVQPIQQIPQPTTPTPTAPQAIGSQATQEAPKIVENPISTQSTLLISELRDSIVIMKDGSFRAVVACQSINFDLMSEQEREGVEYSYQNFLNSLNFTIQILVRSQRVDIGPYIERLTNIRRNNDNMLLGVLMDDYINFIDILSQEANIMDKSFFIVIPYYSSADAEAFVNQTKNLFKTFGKKAPSVTRINRDTYNKAIEELNNRVESVISGLFNIGIHSVRLNTRELAELYYNFNNPDTAVREPLVDFTKLATTYVRKGERTNE